MGLKTHIRKREKEMVSLLASNSLSIPFFGCPLCIIPHESPFPRPPTSEQTTALCFTFFVGIEVDRLLREAAERRKAEAGRKRRKRD